MASQIKNIRVDRHEIICTICNVGYRIDEYDTYVCFKCDRWLEPKCGDKKCSYCKDRPNKPSDRFSTLKSPHAKARLK